MVQPKWIWEAVVSLKIVNKQLKNVKNKNRNKLPPLKRSLDLPTWGQICTVAVLQPFLFEFFRFLYFTYLQLILAQTHVISTFVNGRFIPTSSMTGSVPINTFLSTSFHSPIASSVKWNSWEIRKNVKDKWIIWHKQFWSERGPRYLCHI